MNKLTEGTKITIIKLEALLSQERKRAEEAEAKIKDFNRLFNPKTENCKIQTLSDAKEKLKSIVGEAKIEDVWIICISMWCGQSLIQLELHREIANLESSIQEESAEKERLKKELSYYRDLE